MLFALIIASGLARPRTPLTPPSWLVINAAGCLFKDLHNKLIAIPSDGNPYGINGGFTVRWQPGCGNPTIQAVLDTSIYTQVVLDMQELDAGDGGNYQMLPVPADSQANPDGYTLEVGFSPDGALGGNVSVLDGDAYVPDRHLQERYGLKRGKKLNGLSRFRVRRLSGQGTTSFAGKGTVYHVCEDDSTNDLKSFDLDVVDGKVKINYVDNNHNPYTDTKTYPYLVRIVTDDQPLNSQWEQQLNAYPDDLLTATLKMPGRHPRPESHPK